MGTCILPRKGTSHSYTRPQSMHVCAQCTHETHSGWTNQMESIRHDVVVSCAQHNSSMMRAELAPFWGVGAVASIWSHGPCIPLHHPISIHAHIVANTHARPMAVGCDGLAASTNLVKLLAMDCRCGGCGGEGRQPSCPPHGFSPLHHNSSTRSPRNE
jgi:hypothetical protein